MKTSFHLVLLLYILLTKKFVTEAKEAGNITCIDKERKVLLKFKDGIRNDRCGVLTSWGDEEDCCKWHGIRCSNLTGHITRLNLRNTGSMRTCLEGKLSPSLVELEHLNYLDLSQNNFGMQPIPKFLGSLTKLTHLSLSDAGFRGKIPDELGNLSNLVSLDLSSTPNSVSSSDGISFQFSDPMTAESLQWLSQLRLLRTVDVSGTDLSSATDWLEVINNLPFLTEINMNFCNLPDAISPPLPHSNTSTSLRIFRLQGNALRPSIYPWLFNLSGVDTHLSEVDLSANKLEGPIPSEFGKMRSLSFLDLSRNGLQGPIPQAFGNIHSLSHFSLNNNQIDGLIPDISSLKHLTYLDLSVNNIQGRIPESFAELCSLQSVYLGTNGLTGEFASFIKTLSGCIHESLSDLDLNTNKFWGSVPDTIKIFSSLSTLDLHNNELNGTVSEGIGQLSELYKLDLSYNSLKGIISDRHFSKLSSLRSLDLSHNSVLMVKISSKWAPPFMLDTVILQSCILGPQFPRWIERIKNLQVLDISSAGISDDIPDSFWKSLPLDIAQLNISHNSIRGTLPNLPITFQGVSEIDLSSNYIQGAIPTFFRNVSSLLLNNNMLSDLLPFFCIRIKTVLSSLDLSDNLFSGEFPHCRMHFDQLLILRLDNNKFSGDLPTSIGTLQQLNSLHLRNNSFSGELPASLQNCASLIILDLGYNLFTGYIPPFIGTSLKNLSYLNLRSNHFHGKLPLSLCELSQLQILDLSVNRISGTIPKCIYRLRAMANATDVLDNNYFVIFASPINSGGTVIDSAIVMWARQQQTFRESFTYLKFIDISSNKLEGEIPGEMSSLIGLVSLNLSRNHLTGPIAPSISRLTSLELLDMSNNHFSGDIPTSLATMTYLHVLDVSNNNLSGKIPLGTQLQSFDPTVYMGNSWLCGAPLPGECPGDTTNRPTVNNTDKREGDVNEQIFPGLYISVILGFVTGFWGVCGTLVLKRSWRHAFFQYYDDMKDKLYVIIVVSIAKVCKG